LFNLSGKVKTNGIVKFQSELMENGTDIAGQRIQILKQSQTC